MKARLITLLFCIVVFAQSSAQVKEAPQNLKQQSTKMGSPYWPILAQVFRRITCDIE